MRWPHPPIPFRAFILYHMVLGIITIILALAGSAFISAAESALLSARMSHIQNLAARENRRARLVLSVLRRYENFFATILLFGNLFNIIVAVAASNLIVASFFGGETTIVTNILATASATILVYTLGELTPKTMAAAYPEKWSLSVAHIISALIWISRPVVFIFTVIPVFVLRKFLGVSATQKTIYTTGELSLIIDRSQEGGVFDPTHGEMIDNLLRFGHQDIQHPEGRVHARDIIWLSVNDTLQTFLDTYRHHSDSIQSKHEYELMPGFVVHNTEPSDSRYWYTEDQVAGVVYAKDVMKAIAKDGLNPDTGIKEVLVEKPLKQPGTTHLDDVLNVMIRTGHEMVLSIDKSNHGRVNGIVTLKGILERMRGDEDARELRYNPIEVVAHGWVVPGALSIERTGELTGMELPLSPRYETIAGFFIDKLQCAPDKGAEATHGESLEMEVVRMDGNRIDRLKITNPKPGLKIDKDEDMRQRRAQLETRLRESEIRPPSD